MPDRFDFLEFGDDKPAATAPPPPPVGTIEPEQSWKPLKLRAIEVIGDPGTGAGQFSLPTGIAVDQFGSLYCGRPFSADIRHLYHWSKRYQI